MREPSIDQVMTREVVTVGMATPFKDDTAVKVDADLKPRP